MRFRPGWRLAGILNPMGHSSLSELVRSCAAMPALLVLGSRSAPAAFTDGMHEGDRPLSRAMGIRVLKLAAQFIGLTLIHGGMIWFLGGIILGIWGLIAQPPEAAWMWLGAIGLVFGAIHAIGILTGIIDERPRG